MTISLPTTLDEAIALRSAQPAAALLAGGTDFMVEVNAGHRRADAVIALGRIAELRGWSSDGLVMSIGAGTPYAALEAADAAALAPALAQAARTVGSPQIRAAGTIGGNLATCSPAGDGLPVLAALDALVTLRSPRGSRTMPVGEFMVGVKRTALLDDEIVERIAVPIVSGWQGYTKVGVRNAMVIAVASTALVADMAQRSVRIALGSVGPTVIRCREAEAWVADRIEWSSGMVSPELAVEFGDRVAQEARPIDDHRSTAAYRTHAIKVMASRQLRRAFGAPASGANFDG